jgi:hypothetical protein
MSALFSTFRERESQSLATKGLQKLDLASFRKDYRAFLSREYFLGEHVERLAAGFRRLDEADVRALLKPFGEADAKYLAAGIRVLREKADEPIDLAVPRALDAMWEAGLCERLRAALVAFADPSGVQLPPLTAETPSHEAGKSR